MKLLRYSLLFVFILVGFLQAAKEPEISVVQKVELIRQGYLQSDNIWIEKLQELKHFENIEAQIIELKSKKSVATRKNQEKIYLLEEAQKLYKPNEKGIYYEISKIDEDLKAIQESIQKIDFFDVVTNNTKDELTLLQARYNVLQSDYFKAKNRFEQYIKDLEELKVGIEKDKVTLKYVDIFIKDIEEDLGLLDISYRMFEKKLTDFSLIKNQVKRSITNYKKQKLAKLLYIILIIGVLFLINKLITNYLLRHAKHKDEEGEQKYFALIKMTNIAFSVLSFLVVAFAYIENIAASLAVFGVIGAGLTIVLKEWVLSFIAWFYILGGNFIRPGDRIKIDKDSHSIIGDVADISMFRLTLYENITNDSITEHKKAGRIIFVPNYYVLMYSVYNYTHITMQTIIDLIEINMTFNSNLQRAEKITHEIVEKLTERYSAMAQMQYNKLKNRYSLRNMNMQVRIVFFPSQKGDGVTMGIWYVSPYRQILRLKSEITKQLIKELDKCDDIMLMYTGSSMFIEANHSHESKEIF